MYTSTSNLGISEVTKVPNLFMGFIPLLYAKNRIYYSSFSDKSPLVSVYKHIEFSFIYALHMEKLLHFYIVADEFGEG